MAPNLVRRLIIVAALAVMAVAGTADVASARSIEIPAAGEKRGVATFELKRFSAVQVKSGWIRRPYGQARKRVGVARLRTALRRGTLRVRVTRRWRKLAIGARKRTTRAKRQERRRRAKLVIVVPTSKRPAAPKPQPTEPAPTGACSSAARLGDFAAHAWPDGCWRPYGDHSPFNRPLPTNPRLHPSSSAIVGTLTGWGQPADLRAGLADSSSDWDHPIYYARASDPLYTLHCTEDWGTCEIEGHQVRIPQNARAAGGGDGHMTVIDQTTGWEYDLYKYCYEGCASSSTRTLPPGGGDVYFRWGGRTRIDGDGLDSDATAAHFGLAAGVIRAEEMIRGRIDHALFMVVRCDSGQAVWPAKGLGAKCSDPANAPAEGMRFQLGMSAAQIDALAVPSWKKTILRAMAEYGLYVGDTSGSTPWNIQFESGSSYTSFGAQDRLVSFAKQAGISASSDGRHYFDLAGGVDWRQYLRVVDPCVGQGSC